MPPSRNIHRGIHSPHSRQQGETPGIGQVSRMRDVDIILSGRQRRRSGRGRRKSPMTAANKVLLTWSAVFGLAALSMIGLFVASWLNARGRQNVDRGEPEAVENTKSVAAFVPPGEKEALDLVKRALEIRDPAKVDALISRGGASPEEVVAFLRDLEGRDGTIERFEWASSMDKDGQQIEGVLVRFSGKEKPGARLAFLTPDESGAWRLDFDGFARSSRPLWRELLEGRAEKSEVRVMIAKYNYYNGPFQDDRRWVCFALTSPEAHEAWQGEKTVLCGYCKADSPQAKAMARIFSGGDLVSQEVPMSRAILEIRPVAGAESRQFEIARVLADEWVMPPVPFDERFE